MHQSKAEVYVHFVWATKWREGTIPADLERRVYRVISSEVARSGSTVVALGGMPDHVHLLVKLGRETTLAALMNQVKGVSATFINAHSGAIAGDPDKEFHWQPGYAAYSVGLGQVKRVVEYVRNQKQHHATGAVYPDWEAAPTESRSPPQDDPALTGEPGP